MDMRSSGAWASWILRNETAFSGVNIPRVVNSASKGRPTAVVSPY